MVSPAESHRTLALFRFAGALGIRWEGRSVASKVTVKKPESSRFAETCRGDAETCAGAEGSLSGETSSNENVRPVLMPRSEELERAPPWGGRIVVAEDMTDGLLKAFITSHPPMPTISAPPKKTHTPLGTEASPPITRAHRTIAPDTPDLLLRLRFPAIASTPYTSMLAI
ncbi:Uncharacterised protein [Streptococcus pneumoniae]|nr:Uncharacterised protein [Streptococcus pneumoniae]